MSAGLEPESFWKQTPRSFVTIMEGRSRAAKTHYEQGLSLAWHVEAFARQKRLKPLEKYLRPASRRPTGGDMLATFKAFKKQGAAMTIKKL